jgi:uracil-DNA glycosylase family 4
MIRLILRFAQCIRAHDWSAFGYVTTVWHTSSRLSASNLLTHYRIPVPKGVSLTTVEKSVVSCERCPELRAYIAHIATEKKRAYADCSYWGRPVPLFGDSDARLLLIGLAPGAHGSNRTGRPFTGDASGEFLYPALHRAGFASAAIASNRNDGLRLLDCAITAALHCAPPQNKPTPGQLRNCFPHLLAEFDALPNVRVIVALGSIGFAATLRVLRERGFALKPEKPQFGHGAEAVASGGDRTITVIASFHPSRQNTNTGKLTRPMFDAIFTRARKILAAPPDADADRAKASREPGRARPS